MVAWKDTPRRGLGRVRSRSVTGPVWSGSMVGLWWVQSGSGSGPCRVRVGSRSGPGWVWVGSGLDPGRIWGGSGADPGQVCGGSVTGILFGLSEVHQLILSTTRALRCYNINMPK